MSKGVSTAVRVVAVMFALSLLGGYVWYSQRSKATPETVAGSSTFPSTPTSPGMFNTSKSGVIEVDPVIHNMIEQKSTIRSFVIDPNDAGVPAGIVVGTPTEIIVSSKSINMPIFNVRKERIVAEKSGGVWRKEDGKWVRVDGETGLEEPSEESEAGLTVETPVGISLGSKSIGQMVIEVKPEEKAPKQPIINSTKGFIPVLEPEDLKKMVDEVKSADSDS